MPAKKPAKKSVVKKSQAAPKVVTIKKVKEPKSLRIAKKVQTAEGLRRKRLATKK